MVTEEALAVKAPQPSPNQAGKEQKSPKKNSVLKQIYKQRFLLLMIAPCIIWLIIFCYVPMTGVVIAFQDYQIRPNTFYFTGPWVGFQKFIDFFSQITAEQAIANTIIISLIKLVFGFPLPIIFALLLNEIKVKGVQRPIQTIAYLPHFLSWVIIWAIFGRLLDVDGGLVNQIIGLFGIKAQNFMGSSGWVYPLSYLTEMWKETGWNSIIYFAALVGVNPELYEAAAMDGCSRLKRMWHISLPSIKSTVVILLVLASGGILNSNFDQLYLLQNGGNIDTCRVIDTYIYEKMMKYPFDYSASTAMGLMKSIINILLLLGVNFIADKLTDESLF